MPARASRSACWKVGWSRRGTDWKRKARWRKTGRRSMPSSAVQPEGSGGGGIGGGGGAGVWNRAGRWEGWRAGGVKKSAPGRREGQGGGTGGGVGSGGWRGGGQGIGIGGRPGAERVGSLVQRYREGQSGIQLEAHFLGRRAEISVRVHQPVEDPREVDLRAGG